MSLIRQIAAGLRGLFRRTDVDRELTEELKTFLEMAIDRHLATGMTRDQAVRAARIEVGSFDVARENVRDSGWESIVDTLWQDVRTGLRTLRRSPVVTLVAVISLALGIGANTAIFSILDSLLLRRLSVPEPERLVLVSQEGVTGAELSNPVWEQMRDHATVFESSFASSKFRLDLAQGGPTAFVYGVWATGRFFDVLGVHPALGRVFGEVDDRRGGGPDGPVVVISHELWQGRFGGAADVVGRSLTLSRTRFTIVGVLPSGFACPYVGVPCDVVAPLATKATVLGPLSLLDSSVPWLNVFGRVRPGLSIEAATAALQAIQPQMRTATQPRGTAAGEYLREPFALQPGGRGVSTLRAEYQKPLGVLMAGVALVLLIGCANVANLLLARATARRHELSVRRALGASRARLARQFAVESLMLSAAGAAVGLLFARWSAVVLVAQLRTASAMTTKPAVLDLPFDWRLLGFAGAVAALTTVFFGTLPALRGTRVQPNEALNGASRATDGRRGRGLSGALVVGQVALSLVLVVAAVLLVRTIRTLTTLPLGFDRDRVLIVYVNGTQAGITPSAAADQFDRVRQELATLPGVDQAAESVMTPVSGLDLDRTIDVSGGALLAEKDRVVRVNIVSPEYFATYNTPILAGRAMTDADRPGAAQVAVVNEAFARHFLRGRSPVGRTVRRISSSPAGSPWPAIEIVGLVGDAVYGSLRDPVPPTMYVPIAQARLPMPMTTFSVRAAKGSPSQLASGVAAAIGRVNGALALTIRPMRDQVDATFLQERLVAMLAGFFGAIGLLEAGVGLYGVTAYAVGRRRAEIGVRLALGATPGSVVRLVLRRVVLLVGLGIVIGGVASLWATRLTETLLFGLTPRDPASMLTAALVLATTGLLAGWLPARRAARVDPAVVLRNE